MKNWKFIQVGNAESMIEKEIKIIYEANGKDREKAKEYIAKKYPSIARTGQLDRILDEVAGVPARSKNESIDKQEWSMFQGLKKDAEKEIGNKAIVLKDGNVWVVLYANETKSQEFESEAEAREFAKKVGNRTPGSIASIGPAWMHGGTVYGKMDTDESGKHHNEYVKITWLGEGKGGVANYFIDDRMQSDKLGSLDKNELKRWAEAKIGNADTVSEYNAEIQRLTKKAEELRRMGQGKSAMEIEKQIEKLGKELRELGNSKTGNETKAEEKFGKVMGEYEEGALKTPQGKTVTDPAQAKAIAYSEADKVDNLKRARNAMNKKK